MRRNKKTFTLIEMLIVIVIIGILAAALIPRLQSVQTRARNTKRKADLSQIDTAVRIYFNDNTAFPPNLSVLMGSGIVTSIPSDPKAGTWNPCGWVAGLNETLIGMTTTGFWTGSYEAPCVNPLACNQYNGYLYYTTTLTNGTKYAYLATRMEYEGGVNSWGASNNTGVAHLCDHANAITSTLGPEQVIDEASKDFNSRSGFLMRLIPGL